MYVTHLECSKTGKTYEPNKLYNLSEAGKPLLVRYDLSRAAETLTKESLKDRAVLRQPRIQVHAASARDFGGCVPRRNFRPAQLGDRGNDRGL